MADQQDFVKRAEDLASFAKQAGYVAIGAGVLGFQRAQVRRQEIAGTVERARRAGSLPGCLNLACDKLVDRVKEFDATFTEVIKVVDSTLEPVWLRLPEPAQVVVQQARNSRDELRQRVFKFSA